MTETPEHVCAEHQAARAACEHLHREARQRAEEFSANTGIPMVPGISLIPPAGPPPKTGAYARNICETAADLVNGDRNADYGDALDNFTETAALWSPILGIDVTAEQVALCMNQVKVARLIHNTGHDDSWIEGHGQGSVGNRAIENLCASPTFDIINKARHYNLHPSGVECIEIVRYMTFDCSNAFKYVFRCWEKNGREDLDKARYYLLDAKRHADPAFISGGYFRARAALDAVVRAETEHNRRRFFDEMSRGNYSAALDPLEAMLAAA